MLNHLQSERNLDDEVCDESIADEAEESLNNFEYTIIPRCLPNETSLKLSTNVEPVTTFRANQIDRDLRKNWDIFYKRNGTRFFKDRHWPIDDISRLIEECVQNSGPSDSIPISVLELGCGVGNLLFPLLESHLYDRPPIHFFACDFSPRAIEFVRSNPHFLQVCSSPDTSSESSPRVPTSRCTAFVCNVATDDLSTLISAHLSPASPAAPSASSICTQNDQPLLSRDAQLEPSRVREGVDLATLVFVLSALPPSQMRGALANAYRALRPGGLLLVRDYALHDIAQLRLHRRRHWLPDAESAPTTSTTLDAPQQFSAGELTHSTATTSQPIQNVDSTPSLSCG